MKDYSGYRLQDFLEDETFRDWVLNENADNQYYWQEVIRLYPEQEWVILRAKWFLQNLQFREFTLDPAEQEELLSRIREKVERQEPFHERKREIRLVFRRWIRVAAIFTGLFVIGLIAFLSWENRMVSYKTDFARKRTVILPDGSEVLLRPYSEISFSARDFGEAGRNVWIKGDAVFKVKHLPSGNLFVVHTDKNCRITVLGTEFLVHKREANTIVYLHRGKIKLQLQEDKDTTRELVMNPGETVSFTGDDPKALVRTNGPAAGIASWDGKTLLLDHTTLRRVVDFIHNNYGINIRVRDPGDMAIRVSGNIPLDNLNLLLESLSAVYELNFKNTGEGIVITEDK